MSNLAKLQCVDCSKNATTLSDNEISLLMCEINNRDLIIDSDIKKLKRVFKSKNYTAGIAFTNAVANIAETAKHHPQIIVDYSSVTVIWWSLIIKGLHMNDFIMAYQTSELCE